MKNTSKQSTINKELFEDCIRSFCTVGGTARQLRVSENTLRSWSKNQYVKPLAEVVKDLHSEGCYQLRKMGLDLASKNASVFIFLSKNILGYTDNPMPRPDEAAADGLAKSFMIAANSIANLNLNGVMIPSNQIE